jgi:hypothetical protein
MDLAAKHFPTDPAPERVWTISCKWACSITLSPQPPLGDTDGPTIRRLLNSGHFRAVCANSFIRVCGFSLLHLDRRWSTPHVFWLPMDKDLSTLLQRRLLHTRTKPCRQPLSICRRMDELIVVADVVYPRRDSVPPRSVPTGGGGARLVRFAIASYFWLPHQEDRQSTLTAPSCAISTTPKSIQK